LIETIVAWQLFHNRDSRSTTTIFAERTKKPWTQLLKLLSDRCCDSSVTFWPCEDREVPHRALDGAKPCLRIQPVLSISGGACTARTVDKWLERVRRVVRAIWADKALRPGSVTGMTPQSTFVVLL
jgi:hypothetical protein